MMADEPVGTGTVLAAPTETSVAAAPFFSPSSRTGIVFDFIHELRVKMDSSEEVMSFCRALLTVMVVGMMLWMEWNAIEKGKVPDGLVSLGCMAAGFYLTGDASLFMKMLLSFAFVVVALGFYKTESWVPEAINSQVSIIMGIFFKQIVKPANGSPGPAPPAPPIETPPVTPTAAERAVP